MLLTVLILLMKKDVNNPFNTTITTQILYNWRFVEAVLYSGVFYLMDPVFLNVLISES